MINKNLLVIIVLLFLGVGISGCSKEESAKPEIEEAVDSENPYAVSFTVNLEGDSGARIHAEDTDYTAYILMADLDNPMDSLFDKKVKLIREDNVLKTEPLKFGKGEVELHLFIVYYQDEPHSVAPLSGSAKAVEVEKTLPTDISVPKNELLVLQAPELILVGDSEPRDFGLGYWNGQ